MQLSVEIMGLVHTTSLFFTSHVCKATLASKMYHKDNM